MAIPPFLVSMAAQTAAQALPGLAEKLPDAMSKLYKDAGGGQAVKDLVQTGVGVATIIPKLLLSVGNLAQNKINEHSFNINQSDMGYKARLENFDYGSQSTSKSC